MGHSPLGLQLMSFIVPGKEEEQLEGNLVEQM